MSLSFTWIIIYDCEWPTLIMMKRLNSSGVTCQWVSDSSVASLPLIAATQTSCCRATKRTLNGFGATTGLKPSVSSLPSTPSGREMSNCCSRPTKNRKTCWRPSCSPRHDLLPTHYTHFHHDKTFSSTMPIWLWSVCCRWPAVIDNLHMQQQLLR